MIETPLIYINDIWVFVLRFKFHCLKKIIKAFDIFNFVHIVELLKITWNWIYNVFKNFTLKTSLRDRYWEGSPHCC